MPDFPTMSSGYTDRINDLTIYTGLPKNSVSDKCCVGKPLPGPNTTTQLPSLLLASRSCPPPSPAEFALFPKIAQPCSVRTKALSECTSKSASNSTDPSKRFAQYTRYSVPVPCPPLPDSSRMAGISLPSTRNCNL